LLFVVCCLLFVVLESQTHVKARYHAHVQARFFAHVQASVRPIKNVGICCIHITFQDVI